MIIHTPHTLRSIARSIRTPLVMLFVWDVIVTITYYVVPFPAPGLPLTLFGSVLALILGFRSTSAYQRWWEGRGLWGLMINASRNLSRASRNFMTGAQGQAMARAIVLRQIAYVNALRHQLRRLPMSSDALPYIPTADAEAALTRTNAANALLDATGTQVAQARAQGIIDTIQQTQIERILVDIANAQGGMERLKNTPLPSQFRLFPTYFTHLFCVLLPFGLVEALGPATPLGSTVAGMMFMAVLAIGDDLVDPFANTRHDLPLDTMCRTIEIDLLQGLGESAPAPITVDDDGVLW